MANKPVTAEEVIDKLRLELEYDGMHEYSGTPTEERFEALVPQLRDLLARYDAQPKPRWLKPGEVKEDGRYWAWQPARSGDLPPYFDRHPARLCGHTKIQNGIARDCFPFITIRLSDPDLNGYFFYGPLPEPPPPEVE